MHRCSLGFYLVEAYGYHLPWLTIQDDVVAAGAFIGVVHGTLEDGTVHNPCTALLAPRDDDYRVATFLADNVCNDPCRGW